MGTHYAYKDYNKGRSKKKSIIDHAQDINAMPEYMLNNIPNKGPEYIYVSIPQYKDDITTSVGQWLYLLKYCKVEQGFKAQGIRKASTRLDTINMTDEEKALYDLYRKEQDTLHSNLACAERRGKAEGERKSKIEIAKNMLQKNLEIPLIQTLTGLSAEEISQL